MKCPVYECINIFRAFICASPEDYLKELCKDITDLALGSFLDDMNKFTIYYVGK